MELGAGVMTEGLKRGAGWNLLTAIYGTEAATFMGKENGIFHKIQGFCPPQD